MVNVPGEKENFYIPVQYLQPAQTNMRTYASKSKTTDKKVTRRRGRGAKAASSKPKSKAAPAKSKDEKPIKLSEMSKVLEEPTTPASPVRAASDLANNTQIGEPVKAAEKKSESNLGDFSNTQSAGWIHTFQHTTNIKREKLHYDVIYQIIF